jgi:AraC-like DNA-binding protein
MPGRYDGWDHDGLMEPDTSVAPAERLRRAHLAVPGDTSHRMHRYPAPADLTELLQWFWVPTWSVPPGEESVQRVLQYPCALIVITAEYARFYGVATGVSTTALAGDGWAVGALLQPAAGFLLAGDMSRFTDTHVELADQFGEPGATLAARVRAVMERAPDADASGAHADAIELVADLLRSVLPVDDEGREVNDLVRRVEEDPDLLRVAQLATYAGRSERSLQRLLRRRLGLSPKWLIQRRRLQEATLRLRDPSTRTHLAEMAAELGYADHAHLARDVRTVTGWTPTQLATQLSAPDG